MRNAAVEPGLGGSGKPEIQEMTLAEMAAGTGPKRGLECPECGCRHFEVIKTKPHDGEIGRRRQCRNCGFRITTMEIPV